MYHAKKAGRNRVSRFDGAIALGVCVAALFGINAGKFSAEGLSGEIERIGSELFGRKLDISGICEAVFSGDEQSPFLGEAMTLTATNIKTREKGNLFTRIDWDPNPNA